MLLNIISQSSSKFNFMYSWSEKCGMLLSELLKVCFINALWMSKSSGWTDNPKMTCAVSNDTEKTEEENTKEVYAV